MGVAAPLAGSPDFQISFPVSISKARKEESKVPAMKINPPAVTMGPPRLGHPGGTGGWVPPKSRIEPSGARQRIDPSDRSTATSIPQGGGQKGRPDGPSRRVRKSP